ncbi:bib family protein [Megaselia abdita]
MADESLNNAIDKSAEQQLFYISEKLEIMLNDIGYQKHQQQKKCYKKFEMKTVELWRSIGCEFFASFVYVLIVCASAAGTGVGASISMVLFTTSLASGFSMATLTYCFANISGAHINPSVTLSLAIKKNISFVRCIGYILAQFCGGFAAAFLLYGGPEYNRSNLIASIPHNDLVSSWQRLTIEFILTLVVIQVHHVAFNQCKWTTFLKDSSLIIGVTYSACSLASMPYLNPARALGPSFVLKKWDNNLIYWCIPLVAGILSGIVQNILIKTNNEKKCNAADDNLSIQSEEYETELNKQSTQNHNFQNGQIIQQSKYNQNVYSHAPSGKCDAQEPLYGGTRSLYSRSPPMSRGNLNRSQSVYAKSNTAINRDLAKKGPLMPAQSLYFRTNQISQNSQNSHIQNQNVQNQINLHTNENMYGRNSMRLPMTNTQNMDPNQEERRMQPIYGAKKTSFENASIDTRDINRPESMYGTSQINRGKSTSAQSDDSCYSSYQSPQITPPSRGEHQQQSHVMRYGPGTVSSNSNQIRTQSERKISGTPVISSQQMNVHSQQLSTLTLQNERQQYNQHAVYGTVPTIRN